MFKWTIFKWSSGNLSHYLSNLKYTNDTYKYGWRRKTQWVAEDSFVFDRLEVAGYGSRVSHSQSRSLAICPTPYDSAVSITFF